MSQKILTPRVVEQYYWDNFSTLTPYTQFHFLTRLFLLKQNQRARQELDHFYNEKLKDKTRDQQWDALIFALTNPSSPNDPQRLAYLDRYPTLRPLAREGFAALFAKSIWNLDFTDKAKFAFDQAEVKNAEKELLQDGDTLISLSTYALNFLFLANHFAEFLPQKVLINNLYEVSKQVDSSRSLQSKAYFDTHMVINDSLFYTRPIPSENISTHLSELKKVEEKLLADITQVSVDCLCEISVVFQLLGQKFRLEDEVYKYVSRQASDLGDYLTEPLQLDKNLSQAEHTNSLYISAFT